MSFQKSKVKVGDFIIINEFDRPCTRLVAVIQEMYAHSVVAKYITCGTGVKTCCAAIEDVTKVEDFGVKLELSHAYVTGYPVAPTKAKYKKDGSPRHWQPEHDETHEIRAELYDFLEGIK